MENKKINGLYIVIVSILLLGTVYIERNRVQISTLQPSVIQDGYYTEYYEVCKIFFDSYFIEESGVVKSQISQDELLVIPYEIDLETEVYYLEYLVEDNNVKAFEQKMKYMVSNMSIRERGIGLGGNQEEMDKRLAINLHMIEVLEKAYLKWYDTSLKEFVYNMENIAYTYYEEDIKKETIIDITAFNLYAMEVLAEYKERWDPVSKESQKIVENAYLGNSFPFYATWYDTENNNYIIQENIDMMASLEIVYTLAKQDLHRVTTIDWLKEMLKKDAIYTSYDPNTGKSVLQEENIQIYALIARIAKSINDLELYVLAIEHLLKFQQLQGETFFEGAFIEDEYSIDAMDNLQALLAF